jgi:DNA-binding NtrC family response regulator
MKNILIIDDDPNWLTVFADIFPESEYKVKTSHNYNETISIINTFNPALVFLDYHFGQGSQITGLDILKGIRKKWDKEQIKVFVLTAYGDASKVSSLRNEGADNVISKSKPSVDILDLVTRSLSEKRKTSEATKKPWTECIVGSSDVMIEVANQVLEAVKNRCNTLFLGEVGTGKDVFARFFQRESKWCKKDLVDIYCPQIPSGIMDIDLFGCKKGSFTSNVEDKTGKVQLANQGILFINEIGELPQDAQNKLLSVYDKNPQYYQLGNPNPIAVDVLVVAATYRDLKSMVEKGEFSEALYSRLESNIIHIPPLREHLEDIPELVEYFIAEYNASSEKQISQVETQVMDYLLQQKWERNVRQLRHVVLRGARKSVGSQLTIKDILGLMDEEKKLSTEHYQASSLDVTNEVFKASLDKQHSE